MKLPARPAGPRPRAPASIARARSIDLELRSRDRSTVAAMEGKRALHRQYSASASTAYGSVREHQHQSLRRPVTRHSKLYLILNSTSTRLGSVCFNRCLALLIVGNVFVDVPRRRWSSFPLARVDAHSDSLRAIDSKARSGSRDGAFRPRFSLVFESSRARGRPRGVIHRTGHDHRRRLQRRIRRLL